MLSQKVRPFVVAQQGGSLLQPGVNPGAQVIWPDTEFTVDAAGNTSPPYGYVPSGQRATWTFPTPSPAPMRSSGRRGAESGPRSPASADPRLGYINLLY